MLTRREFTALTAASMGAAVVPVPAQAGAVLMLSKDATPPMVSVRIKFEGENWTNLGVFTRPLSEDFDTLLGPTWVGVLKRARERVNTEPLGRTTLDEWRAILKVARVPATAEPFGTRLYVEIFGGSRILQRTEWVGTSVSPLPPGTVCCV